MTPPKPTSGKTTTTTWQTGSNHRHTWDPTHQDQVRTRFTQTLRDFNRVSSAVKEEQANVNKKHPNFPLCLSFTVYTYPPPSPGLGEDPTCGRVGPAPGPAVVQRGSREECRGLRRAREDRRGFRQRCDGSLQRRDPTLLRRTPGSTEQGIQTAEPQETQEKLQQVQQI